MSISGREILVFSCSQKPFGSFSLLLNLMVCSFCVSSKQSEKVSFGIFILIIDPAVSFWSGICLLTCNGQGNSGVGFSVLTSVVVGVVCFLVGG